ncbi:MAG: PDZ domain-containing protein, partial [Gammaproteobacteria bacterium]
TGKVTRGRIGVQIGEVSKEVAESLGLGTKRGVEVTMVEPGAPADKGGIKVGDIILKYNGQAVERPNDLQRLVGSTTIGSRATVTVWRKGQQQDLPLTIAELDDDKGAKKTPGKKNAPEQKANALGLNVSDLGEAEKREFQVDGGVVVDAAEGAASRAGLQPGDVILQVNNVDVRSASQFNALVAKLDPKKAVALLVRREGSTQYVVIKPRS